METFTIAELIKDMIPRHCGMTATEGYNIAFPDHIIDGGICAISYSGEPLASFRIRFTNSVILGPNLAEAALKCVFTNCVFLKPSTAVATAPNSQVLVDVPAEDNVPGADLLSAPTISAAQTIILSKKLNKPGRPNRSKK